MALRTVVPHDRGHPGMAVACSFDGTDDTPLFPDVDDAVFGDIDLDETASDLRKGNGKTTMTNETNDQEVILSRSDPMPSGRRFVELLHTADEIRLLHYHNGGFYSWTGTHYENVGLDAITRDLYHFLEKASTFDKEGKIVPFRPNRSLVGEVIAVTKCEAYLNEKISAPSWIDRKVDDPPALEMIVCRNGRLHYPTRTLYPHTPRFFTTNALPFDYDLNATAFPNWQRFLDDLWDDDIQSIGTLQEFFGYCLTADTAQQKIFLLIGPRRSGKGTIAIVLTALVGVVNVCNPTLASLSTNFGVSPLIGKRLSITGDVRMGSRTDTYALSERLLSISGEDGITVDRKHKEPWTGKLGVRFLLLSNKVPKILDSSGALSSRFIVLSLTESFFGREDVGLQNRLLGELPAILNWALDGLDRLQSRGHFEQPTASADVIKELEDLASPTLAFIEECMERGAGYEVSTKNTFLAWCGWCVEQKRDHAGTIQTFGSDLRAAMNGKLKGPQQVRRDGEHVRLYFGLRLSENGRRLMNVQIANEERKPKLRGGWGD